MQYCSLQHRILLLSPVPSTIGCCFCFGSIPSFFLELFLHWPPVAYWAPTDLGSTSFSILSFCLFILFMGFLRQEYWSGLPFPSPVDQVLSDLSTMTRPSWVAPWAWLSFIELDKAVVLVWLDWLVFCDYDFSVSALWCSLTIPTILLGFLLPWGWGISSWLLQQIYIFPFIFILVIFSIPFGFSLLFFPQLFVRLPQTAILLFCISFPWGWSWSLSSVQCHEPPSIDHQLTEI